MTNPKEQLTLARYLANVQKRCTVLINEQQKEIDRLKRTIAALETALHQQQNETNANPKPPRYVCMAA